ncbi:MAG: hypothetical protein PVI23_16750 [Maricaulaceae bacterium]|jgi:hypothetical protein
MDESAMAAAGLIYLLVVLAMIVVAIVANWKIFSKAGHPGPLSLLMIIPIVGLITYLWFAFSEWPVQKRLRELEGGKPFE